MKTMKTPKLILSELKSVNEPPTKDGYYIVFGIGDKGRVYYVAHIHFTTAYGWNTYDHFSSSQIVYEKDDNTYFWCTAEATKGDKK